MGHLSADDSARFIEALDNKLKGYVLTPRQRQHVTGWAHELLVLLSNDNATPSTLSGLRSLTAVRRKPYITRAPSGKGGAMWP